MSFYKYILAGLTVGLLSFAYNIFTFNFIKIYPDGGFILPFIGQASKEILYALILLRGFLIGIILMYLFAHGAQSLTDAKGEFIDDVKTVFFFSAYAIFSLLVFTIGDYILMSSYQGILLLITVDSLIETMISLVPIRIFYFSWHKSAKKG